MDLDCDLSTEWEPELLTPTIHLSEPNLLESTRPTRQHCYSDLRLLPTERVALLVGLVAVYITVLDCDGLQIKQHQQCLSNCYLTLSLHISEFNTSARQILTVNERIAQILAQSLRDTNQPPDSLRLWFQQRPSSLHCFLSRETTLSSASTPIPQKAIM